MEFVGCQSFLKGVAKEEVDEDKQRSDGENRALLKLKEGLLKVKVSKVDATEVQREIESKFFDSWAERHEVMEAKGIALVDIPDFLDHMQDAYDGIDEKMRKKMKAIEWAKEWGHRILEFKLNTSSKSGAMYGMVAFGKYNDGGIVRVDCMYCLYKVDFEIAPVRILTKTKRSLLFGLIEWETLNEIGEEKKLGEKIFKRIKNFFRYKALEGFYKEGLVDEINFVHSIEDADDDESGN